jgi:hypothetical protein
MTQVVPPRRVAALAVALVLVLLAPAGARAFSVDVSATPQTPTGALPPSGPTAAGAHPNLVTTLDFGSGAPADSVKSLVIHFAPGIVAFINHLPACESWDASSSTATTGCDASVAGSTSTSVTAQPPLLPPVPLTLSGTIYKIDPPPGFPAAFGIDIPAAGTDIKLVSPISVDPHDLGLTATLDGLPNDAKVLGVISSPLHIDSITQTLNGYAPDGKSFFTSPTACIPAPIAVTATSYAGASAAGSASYTPTDCANEPFSTTLAIAANPSITDSPSEISADVQPGNSDIPRVNSHVKSDTVTLPPGVLINPALAARLDACTDAQFAQSDTSVPASCPPSSAVGDITFVSPILGAFPGKAYFGTQTPSDRLRLFLDVPLYGAHIKVSAHVHPDFTTGQITTVFDELPQIAFTDFQLTFHGGPQSALVTPTTCGTNTASALVYPWSGGPPSTSTASFTTSYDGMGGACQRIFAPTVGASVSTPRAGASPAFTLTVDRPDRNVPIGRMRFALPAGLVGSLALKGLTRCSLADAAADRCPASSRIGAVAAIAGSGSEPPTLPGGVYLTAPKVAGDPAGLSVVVPAKLGPVDAGTVIVGARLALRSDGGLNVTSDEIPALQQGIPLALRELKVTIDRPGFMRNPTSCGAKPLTASFDALGGGSAQASTSLTFSGCEQLPFHPRFTVKLGAKHATGAGTHPPLATVLTQQPGEAGLGRVRVVLPTALATNLRAVAAACQPADFTAGHCPAASRVASARAVSPLVSAPLTGAAYLVSTGLGKLPKVTVALRGPLTFTFDGTVSIGKGSNIATTFLAPDLPVTRFSLTFHGGRFGALTASRNLCTKRGLRLRALLVGQNGKKLTTRPRFRMIGCRKHG